MNPARLIAALVPIQAGEGRAVLLFALQSFCIGVARICTISAGYALFLDAFDAAALPFVYFGIAATVLLVGGAYLRLQTWLPFTRLMLGTLGGLLLVLLAFRIGLSLPGAALVTIGLPIFYDLLWALSNLVSGSMAGHYFTVRQGKRLFSLIEAGESLAVIGGGMLLPLLSARIGPANLLLVAALGVAGALVALVTIVRTLRPPRADGDEQEPEERSTGRGPLLGERYLRIILALGLLSGLCYYLLDSTFFSFSSIYYGDPATLAGFLGLFYAICELLSLLSRSLLSGRLLARYGVAPGALVQPALLLLGVLGLIVGATFGAPPVLLFWLVLATKLIDTVTGEDINKTVTQILYQPLPAAQRLRAQTLVDTGMTPLATGLAGALLLLGTAIGLGPLQLAWLLLGLVLVWLVLARLAGRAYATMLLRALERRWLGRGSLTLGDGQSRAVLARALESPHPAVVLYALGALEEHDSDDYLALLGRLLDHPAPPVRLRALEGLARLPAAKTAPLVLRRLPAEPDSEVLAAGLRLLAAGQPAGQASASAYAVTLAGYLDHPTPPVRLAALAGLLRAGGYAEATARATALFSAPLAADRAGAAWLIGEGLAPAELLPELLRDPDPAVVVAALGAARHLRQSTDWPLVTRMLGRPALHDAAAAALLAGGERALPALADALEQPDTGPELSGQLIRLGGRIGSPAATGLLERRLDRHAPPVEPLLLTLGRLGYRAAGERERRIQSWIEQTVAEAGELLAAAVALESAPEAALLREALRIELDRRRDRALLLLALLVEAPTVLNARARLAVASAEQRAYAVEMLDILLPAALRPRLLPLLDDLAPAELLRRLGAPGPRGPREQLVAELARDTGARLSTWTRACALFTLAADPAQAALLASGSARSAIAPALSAPQPLLRETAAWALRRIDTSKSRVAPGEVLMLSTIERVLFLKTVDLFAGTPDDVLADVATLLREVELPAGALLFRKGEAGTCLYIVVSGRVSVHDDGRFLNYLEERDVCGEMAVLDTAPRSATVSADTDTLLLQLDQGPLYELMAERFEVVRAIILTLSRRVRRLMEARGGAAPPGG